MSGVNVKFGAEDTNLTSTLNKVQKELKQVETQSMETNQKFGMSFKGMAAAAAGVAIGIGAIKLAFNAVQGTVSAFGDALDMGGRLADLSARTGESAGKLLLLERAFTNAGSSAEKVGPTINKLQKFIVDAGDSTSKQRAAMVELGLSYADMVNKSPTEQLRNVAQALSGVGNDAKRGALAIEIFGRSGGELLPFLRSFQGSLSDAKAELGSMARIMDEHSETFDTVSDTIQNVKGKFVEFAAGILSQTVPALELFTVALSRVDAAALGERLAKAFVGGQAAMNGFSASLQALKGGEFALSFEMAFAAIKLQSKQTINEIYRNFVAGFSSIAGFMTETMGAESNAFMMIRYAFDILSKEISAMFLVSMSEVVRVIPFLSDAAADSMLKTVGKMRTETGMMKQVMAIHASQIGSDFMKAGSAFPDSFKKSYAATKPLMNLEKDLANVAKLQAEINKKAPSLTHNMMDDMKGMSLSTFDMRNHLQDGAKSITNAAKDVKESLSLSTQIIAKIKEFNNKNAVDPGGKLEKKANEAIADGDVRKANRIGMKILEAEDSAKIHEAFGGGSKSRKSIRDIAKEQGVDTSGKTNARLKWDLLDIANTLKKDVNKPGEEKRNERIERGGGNKVDNPMEAIKTAVEAIKALVAKIEPKLPTAALGI